MRRTFRHVKLLIHAVILFVLFNNCGQGFRAIQINDAPSIASTPTPTSTPLATATPGPSSTPTPSATPVPTPTPTPTPRPSSTPTPVPTPTPFPTATPTPLPTPVDGTALSNLARQMQAGEWRELSTNGFNNMLLPNQPGDGSSSILEFSDEAKWNPLTKKIWIMGCARGAPDGTSAYECGTSAARDAGFIEYDENTNSWKRLPTAPVGTAPHGYDNAALNPVNGDYYFNQSSQLENHKIWKFSDNQWTTLPSPDQNAYAFTGAIEIFPELNKLIYIAGGPGAHGDERLYMFSLPNSAWSSVPITAPIGEYSHFTEYSARHKIVYFGGSENSYGNKTLLKLDSQGQMTQAADSPVALGIGGTGGRQSVDPVTGNLLVFTNKSSPSGSNSVYSYDPVTNKWTQHGTHPLSFTYDGDSYSQISVFTPIPEYGVVFAAKYGGGSKVYLYKHSNGP